ncbi:hypothetical protein BpHYR1_028713 [Brachionus plicatilis]|uniref:Uncharacterized protein n=1 Tax=Brachionus plicatilis TaxID=10195 RepID=A0A3M7PRP3_BRAPC|nr:hypothetical protein BpHYR1_028713 [Brachionus plicatilis]
MLNRWECKFSTGAAASSSLTGYQVWDRRNKISPERAEYTGQTGLFARLLHSDRSSSDGWTGRPFFSGPLPNTIPDSLLFLKIEKSIKGENVRNWPLKFYVQLLSLSNTSRGDSDLLFVLECLVNILT